MILSRRQPPGPFPFVLVLDGLKTGYNAPKIVRSANAFGCRELHFVGMEAFDPGPAVGALRSTRSATFETFAESYAQLAAENYTIFALEASGDAVLGVAELPERSAFVLGHEQFGFSFPREEYPSICSLRIPQFGVVESLNVAVASGLACFEYVRQRGFQCPT